MRDLAFAMFYVVVLVYVYDFELRKVGKDLSMCLKVNV